MSNYLAIATVTAWLKQSIQEAVQAALPQATVIVGPPKQSASGGPEASLTLFQVEPNASLRNDHLASRNSDGVIVQRPQSAVDLHYLVSFFGDGQDFSTDRMVGKVVNALNLQPVLTREQIHKITNPNGPFPELADSNLADQTELVRLTPVFLTLEELSKLWTVFFQVTHRVSLTYVASVVLIDADVSPQHAIPVHQASLGLKPGPLPKLHDLQGSHGTGIATASSGNLQESAHALLPQLRGVTPAFLAHGDATALILHGNNLSGTAVRIDGVAAVSNLDASGDLVVPRLPEGLLAGMKQVEVVHDIVLPSGKKGIAASNRQTFVLQPELNDVAYLTVADPRRAFSGQQLETIQLTVSPPVGPEQPVMLWLNQTNVPAESSRGYGLSSLLRFGIAPALQAELEEGRISTALSSEFKTSGISLSDDSTLKASSNHTWVLLDSTAGQQYLIQAYGQSLAVYFGLKPDSEAGSVAFEIQRPSTGVATAPGDGQLLVAPGTYLVRLQVDGLQYAESRLLRAAKGATRIPLKGSAILKSLDVSDQALIDEVRKLLARHSRELSRAASVTDRSVDLEWLIRSAGHSFRVRDNGKALSVFVEDSAGKERRLFTITPPRSLDVSSKTILATSKKGFEENNQTLSARATISRTKDDVEWRIADPASKLTYSARADQRTLRIFELSNDQPRYIGPAVEIPND